MRYGFIYETTNLVNGMKYVGSHARTMRDPEDPDDSWYLGSGKYLINAIEYYGVKSFSRVILFEADSEEELSELETNYLLSIDAANNPNYYNLTNSGYNKGSLGRVYDEESRLKMSDHNYVRINGRTESSKRKQAATLKENNHQDLLADSVRGTIWITNGLENKRVYEEDLSKYNESWYRGFTSNRENTKHSDSTREKISKSVKAYAQSTRGIEFYSNMQKDVRMNPKGKVWISKEGKRLMIFPSELDSYLELGWKRGMKS